MGNTEITSGAFKLLMYNNIDTVFLSKSGSYHGKIAFDEGKNVFLRQNQYQLLNDHEFTLGFIRNIARGKLHNQMNFAKRFLRSNHDTTHRDTVNKMEENIRKIDDTFSPDEIRGLEGIGARYYFSLFKNNIHPEWAVFRKRSMRPPEDNVNAVLGFLYTLISNRVDSALITHGLDNYVGYFHTLDYGKKALTFDLMEEFRTPIGDALACTLFNKGILKEEDFYSPEPKENEVRGVLIKKDQLKKVISHFEEKMNSEVYYSPGKKKYSWQRVIDKQVLHFKQVISGEVDHYIPFTPEL